MAEPRQNYDGPDWKRPAIEGEVERRFPGEYFTKLMSDDELRTLLMAHDQGKKQILDNTLGMQMNKIARKVHDLGNAMRIEWNKMIKGGTHIISK